MIVKNPSRRVKIFPVVASVSVIVVSVGSCLIELLPNSVLLNRYKKLTQLKKFEETVPLSKSVQNLYYEVLNDLNIDEKKRTSYEPYACIGYDLIHGGVPTSKFGAKIGIPVNYTYEKKALINASDIRIGYNQERLNIYNPAANNLLDSLILSDKAKKFGIAKEILTLNKNTPIYRSIDSPVMILMTFVMAEFCRVKLAKSFKMPFPLKATFFGLTGLLGYSVWFQFRDSLNLYFEKCVDKELANLKTDYIEGGKEYYEKLLQKNIALRTLLGEQGIKEFNKDGNEISHIRRKKIPLTERKEFFNNLLFPKDEKQNI